MPEALVLFSDTERALGPAIWLIELSAKAGIILMLTIGVGLALSRASAHVRHRVWSLALVGILALPVLGQVLPAWQILNLPCPVMNEEPSTPTVMTEPDVPLLRIDAASPPVFSKAVDVQPMLIDTAAAVPPETSTVATQLTETRMMGEPTVHWSAWVLLVWGGGCVIALACLVIGVIRAIQLARSSDSFELSEGLAEQCLADAGISRTVLIGVSDRVPAPMTFGLMRPTVLLPEDARSWSDDRLRIVLLHELAHVKRGDWVVQILAQFVCAIYWFNPLAWQALRILSIERELACDEAVVATGTRPSDYATTLLDIAVAMKARACPRMALAMGATSQLEQRLTCILNRRRGVHRRAVVLPVVAMFAASMASIAALTPWHHPEPTVAQASVVDSAQSSSVPADAQHAVVVSVSSAASWLGSFDFEFPSLPSDAGEQRSDRLGVSVTQTSPTVRPAPLDGAARLAREDQGTGKAAASFLTPRTPNAQPQATTVPSAGGQLRAELEADREILWQRVEALCRRTDREVRRAVLLEDFRAADSLIGALAHAVLANRRHAGSATRYREVANRVRQLEVYVAQEKAAFQEDRVRAARDEIREREANRIQVEQRSREHAENAMLAQASSLQAQGHLDQAITVLDRLLQSNPRHEEARDKRQAISDQLSISKARGTEETHDRAFQDLLLANGEAAIPVTQLLTYPEDWPERTARRTRTDELLDPPATRVARRTLGKVAPEIRFDTVSFEDVIDRLRALTGLNIVANWGALEAVAIERDAEVTLKLRDVTFRKALELVLDEVGAGDVELGYEIDEGVIRISTREDLGRRTIVRVYNIRDLAGAPPNFRGRRLNLQNIGQGNGPIGFGGGNGSRQDGGFLDGNPDDGEEEDHVVTDPVNPIIDLIQETIEPDSWREAGGTSGSIAAQRQQLIITQTAGGHGQIRDL